MLTLIPTIEADLELIVKIEQDPQNRRFIVPYTLERHLEVIKSQDEEHLTIRDQTNQLIGFVILSGTSGANDCIEFRRIVIVPKGKGFGSKIVNLIKDYCFCELRCHRLWLDVFDFNKRAQNLYQKAGFFVEGKLRDCIKLEDDFGSLVVMSMLKNEYDEYQSR